MATNSVEGYRELQQAIRRLGALPQKYVTRATRMGANVILRASRKRAPVDTGDLRRGLTLKGERSRTKGKKSYQVTFKASMNDIFVKTSKAGKRSYYPSSQEYGYQNRGGGYTPGYNYLRRAADENKVAAQNKIIDETVKKIDEAWRGRR